MGLLGRKYERMTNISSAFVSFSFVYTLLVFIFPISNEMQTVKEKAKMNDANASFYTIPVPEL